VLRSRKLARAGVGVTAKTLGCACWDRDVIADRQGDWSAAEAERAFTATRETSTLHHTQSLEVCVCWFELSSRCNERAITIIHIFFFFCFWCGFSRGKLNLLLYKTRNQVARAGLSMVYRNAEENPQAR
jgi:hypothetical protein